MRAGDQESGDAALKHLLISAPVEAAPERKNESGACVPYIAGDPEVEVLF